MNKDTNLQKQLTKEEFESYIKALQQSYFTSSNLLIAKHSLVSKDELRTLKFKIINSITLYFDKVESGDW